MAVILEKVSLSRSEGLEIRIIPANILITTSDSESGVLLLGWLIFCESRHDEIAGMQIEKSKAKLRRGEETDSCTLLLYDARSSHRGYSISPAARLRRGGN